MTKVEKLSKERKSLLIDFCKKAKLKFNNLELLDQAFNHRSITNERKNVQNNERLEFLGDSVLGMVTASYLYKTLDNPEGELAKIKSTVVSEKALYEVASSLNIKSLLILGKGEEHSGGREKPAILADCVEAIIGAYYLDSGYSCVEKFVLRFIIPSVNQVLTNGMKDFKSLLQEKYQKIKKQCPKYEVISVSGPDHNQIFEVVVYLDQIKIGPCTGKSKKEAEQKVAKLALDYLSS